MSINTESAGQRYKNSYSCRPVYHCLVCSSAMTTSVLNTDAQPFMPKMYPTLEQTERHVVTQVKEQGIFSIKLLDLTFNQLLNLLTIWIDQLDNTILERIECQLRLFTVDTVEELTKVMLMVYDTAIAREDRRIYAKLCRVLAEKTADDRSGSCVTFKCLLLNHCQKAFEQIRAGTLSCPAAIDLIGHLYNECILPTKVLRFCIEKLVSGVYKRSHEVWKHLHVLLVSVGEKLEISAEESPHLYPWTIQQLMDQLEQVVRLPVVAEEFAHYPGVAEEILRRGALPNADLILELFELRKTKWIPMCQANRQRITAQEHYDLVKREQLKHFNKQVDLMAENLIKAFSKRLPNSCPRFG